MGKLYFFIVFFLFANAFCFAQTKVYFEFDKYELTIEAKQKIQSVVRDTNIKQLIIIGYTDSVGTAAYNLQLSNKRVVTVKSYLMQLKPNLIINTDYKGELTEESSDYLNRHVFITWVKNATQINDSMPLVDVPTVNTDHVKVKKKLSFSKIYFYPNTATFKPEAYKELGLLFEEVKKMTDEKIEIRGHINWPPQFGQFNSATNLFKELSLNRAKAVYQYLKEKGAAMQNISVRGMDNTEMVFKNAITNVEMEQNMRVEIAILEK